MTSNNSKKVDLYIENSRPFARPILEKIRGLMHASSPHLEETIKWSCPHFEHKGIVAQMAAFNAHVRFSFWKGALMASAESVLTPIGEKTQMGALKLRSVDDLPADDLFKALVLEAIALNEEGVNTPTRGKTKKVEIDVPDWLMDAISINEQAFMTFNEFSPSNRREYVEWVLEAKREATKQSRLAQAIEWMAQGKPRNWKYMDKWR